MHPGARHVDARQKLLALITARQIEIGALYLDGLSQVEIAEREQIDQATVSRALRHLRRACEQVGAELPQPERVTAADEIQLSDKLYLRL